MSMLTSAPEELQATQTRHSLAELELLLDQCTATYLGRPQTVIDGMRVGLLLNEAWHSFRHPDVLDWTGMSRSLVKIASQVGATKLYAGSAFTDPLTSFVVLLSHR